MSNHIEQKPQVQPQTAPQNPETTAEPTITNPEYSGYANGNENGGIYFELNWDTGQAQYRQQQLLTTYSGSNPGENSGYNPEHNSNETFPGSNYFSFNGSSYTPESNGYGGNSSETSLYGYGENSTFPDYYAIRTNESGSLFSSEDSSVLSWDDFINLVSNHHDFSAFQSESKDFWRELRQFSETPIFQNDDGIELKSNSRYEDLLNEFESKEIPLDEFVESLPSNEKELFKARYQIDKTFGDNIFETDGVTLNEKGQLRAREVAIDGGQFQDLPETVQLELQGRVTFVDKNGEAIFPNKNENVVLARNENGEMILTRRDALVDAENAALFGENIPANQLIPEKIESNELKLPDKSAQIAIGNNGSSILFDNGTTRVLNHVGNTDNSSSVNSINRRDGGTVLGGALISGSFASVANFKNSENKGIGNPDSTNNSNFGGRNNFAAGATGAMMSAAIGSLVPGSDAVVGGVIGFISGVVIGVEADQGLRWLSGDRPTAIASPGIVNLLEENSFAPTLQPVLA